MLFLSCLMSTVLLRYVSRVVASENKGDKMVLTRFLCRPAGLNPFLCLKNS